MNILAEEIIRNASNVLLLIKTKILTKEEVKEIIMKGLDKKEEEDNE